MVAWLDCIANDVECCTLQWPRMPQQSWVAKQDWHDGDMGSLLVESFVKEGNDGRCEEGPEWLLGEARPFPAKWEKV